MSALTDYCDEIYKYSCEYGKEQIGHEGMTIVRLPLEQDNQQDDQQESISSNSSDEIISPIFFESIPKKCYAARQKCLYAIKEGLIHCGTPKAKRQYAELVIEDMSYIMLNHPITYSKTLTNIVRYEVFALILSEFEKDKINISPLLEGRNIEFGSTLYAFFCKQSYRKWIKKSKSNSRQENFEDMFFPKYKPHIFQFIQRLEENNIIQDGIYNHHNDNYLGKLICYMEEHKIIRANKRRNLIHCFYERFGKKVGKKAGDGMVTESNITKIFTKGNAGLSEDERNEFKHICSVFIP